MKQSIDPSDIARKICTTRKLSLQHLIGEGTYKQTFLVNTADGQQLALKVYKSDIIDERSKREIGAMKRCNHHGIARLYHIGIFKYGKIDHLFTIEEYLSGGTLHQRVQRDGFLDIPFTINIGSQLIGAIEHIQALHLVHRDLKPDNILFRNDGDTCVITDFGLVRDLNATSVTNTWIMQGPGTPFFAAPEQLNNEKLLIDWRTDQFSLGILLYVSMFGDHPFMTTGMSNKNTVNNVAQRRSVSKDFISNIKSSGLIALETMVAVWPAQRYRTPRILAVAWGNQGI